MRLAHEFRALKDFGQAGTRVPRPPLSIGAGCRGRLGREVAHDVLVSEPALEVALLARNALCIWCDLIGANHDGEREAVEVVA